MNEQRRSLQALIAAPLRIGTVAAVALVVVGLVLAFGETPDPDAPAISSFRELLADGGGRVVIGAGLFVLTLIPVATLVGALVGFAMGGERRYVAVTAVVLALLVGSAAVAALLVAAPG